MRKQTAGKAGVRREDVRVAGAEIERRRYATGAPGLCDTASPTRGRRAMRGIPDVLAVCYLPALTAPAMEGTMTSCGQWVFAAGLMAAVAVPAWSGATKPLGGLCECGPYVESPAVCAPLAKAKREACISANLSWLGKCTAWRDTMCHAPAAAAEPVKAAAAPVVLHPSVAEAPPPAAVAPSPAPVAQAPAPVVPAPVQPAPIIASPALTKFGGTWTGEAQCRAEKWRLKLYVAQLADGSLLTNATTGQLMGSFGKIEIKDNGIVLHYSTGLSEAVYAGHLAGPSRIEGTVHVAGSDCKWYLTR